MPEVNFSKAPGAHRLIRRSCQEASDDRKAQASLPIDLSLPNMKFRPHTSVSTASCLLVLSYL